MARQSALASLVALTLLAALILLGMARIVLEPQLLTAMLVVHSAIVFATVSSQTQLLL